MAFSDLEEQGLSPNGWDTLKTGVTEYRLRLNYRYRMRYRLTERQTLVVKYFISVIEEMLTDKTMNKLKTLSG